MIYSFYFSRPPKRNDKRFSTYSKYEEYFLKVEKQSVVKVTIDPPLMLFLIKGFKRRCREKDIVLWGLWHCTLYMIDKGWEPDRIICLHSMANWKIIIIEEKKKKCGFRRSVPLINGRAFWRIEQRGSSFVFVLWVTSNLMIDCIWY